MRGVFETVLPWEERGITFIGDPHTFKTKQTTEQLRQDLEAARDRNDLIAIWGDIDEWILPSDLKRYNNAKHGSKVNAYINRRVKELADFYDPYADHIRLMKLGNHETEVIKRHHVDPIALLVQELNRRRDPRLEPICYGGYTLWWLVKMVKTPGGRRSISGSVKFWLHHGAGGSAPVTRGAIDRARIYDSITSDVYVIGHKHQALHIRTKHESLDSYGNVRRADRDFILIAGYSGWEQSLPNVEDGYILDWSAEKFYGLESTGSARVLLKPYQHHSAYGIRRIIQSESAA